MNANNSRAYYVSNENMSDINESIDAEYSMNYDQYSNANSKSQISEMISGSHQITQSRNQYKTKPLPKAPIIQEEQPQQNEPHYIENKQKKAIFLGDHVYNNIKERYFETNKITTEDPEVLYDFYLSQRKAMMSKGGKPFTISQKQLEKLMPSMQRKMLVKVNFEKILQYYQNDVSYSLCFQAEKINQDRQLTHKAVLLNEEMNRNNKKKKTKKEMEQIVMKLHQKNGQPYSPKNKEINNAEMMKRKRTAFGRNLSQVFQNAYREKGQPYNVETHDKLFNYWQDTYERQQYGIQWQDATAKETIKQYMYEQVEDLLKQASRKLGFKSEKAGALRNFYIKNKNIENIYIPVNSFEEYIKLYNQIQKQKGINEEKKTKENYEKEVEKKKKHEMKKFGRPVSATPITILSKPKTSQDNIQQLMQKYPNDKMVKAMMMEQNLKQPRHAYEYGMYNITEQIKTKQWIKPDPKKATVKYEDTINKMLFQTFTKNDFNQIKDKDQLMSLFAEQYIETDEHWKQLGPIMHEAMLVKAYENHWFVDCIIKYLQRNFGDNFKVQTNTFIFKKLFKHLNQLSEDSRRVQLQKIEHLILTSQQIAQKAQKINHLNYKGDNFEKKQKKLLYSLLEDKVIEYKKKKKNKEKFDQRKYFNQMFEHLLKQHKQFVVKRFHVVEHQEKECPKLLKYEFFRYLREVNPMTLERDPRSKSHAWVPTKSTPQNINYKTFNNVAQAYSKNKNVIIADAEKDKFKETLWSRAKGKERQKLMMTYNDAKECTFQPKISKKYI